MGCSPDPFPLCPWDHLRSCLCLWERVFVCFSLFLGLKLHVRAIFSIFSVSLTLSDPLLPCGAVIITQPRAEPGWGSSPRMHREQSLCTRSFCRMQTSLTGAAGHLEVKCFEVFREQQEQLFVFHPTWCFRCLRHRAVSIMSSQLLSGITTVLCHSWSKSLYLHEKWSGSQLNNSKNPARSESEIKIWQRDTQWEPGGVWVPSEGNQERHSWAMPGCVAVTKVIIQLNAGNSSPSGFPSSLQAQCPWLWVKISQVIEVAKPSRILN